MKRLITLLIVFVMLAACAPSQQAIQEANLKTKEAMTTNTPQPTPTPIPTNTPPPTPTPIPTKNPCSDKGWVDIGTYLKQYDIQISNIVVGSSIGAYLDSLENYSEKINEVEVDACTEHARQSIISGLTNRTYGMRIVLTKGDQDEAFTAMLNGKIMINEAIEELAGLVINLDYP